MLASIPFPNVSPTLFSYKIRQWDFVLMGQDFSLGGFEFAIRWYALAYIFGILVASWLIRRIIRMPNIWPNKNSALTEKTMIFLMH